MKKCKYCKEEIDSKAKVCPHCKKKQGHPILLIIFLIILIQFLVATVKGVNSKKSEKDSDLKVKTSVSDTAEPSKESKDNTTADESTEAPTEAEPPTEDESKVIYDENGIKITYKGTEDGFASKDIKLLIENNSDKNYTVQERDLTVNGFVVMATISADIPAGKKANDEIKILESSLEENEITDIENVEFYFHIFNSDDWTDDFDSDIITLTK